MRPRRSRSRTTRLGKHRAVEPALAVDVVGDDELALERSIGTGCDRHVRRPTSSSTGARSSSSSRASGCRGRVVMPSSSTSGLASASRIAIASSWPGSQSRIDRRRHVRSIVDVVAGVREKLSRLRALASQGPSRISPGVKTCREGEREDLRLPRAGHVQADDGEARRVARPRARHRRRGADRLRPRQGRAG